MHSAIQHKSKPEECGYPPSRVFDAAQAKLENDE